MWESYIIVNSQYYIRGIYKLETKTVISRYWLINRVPVNCTPGRRCVSLLVNPSRWNVTSRRCTSPLCYICFAAKLTGTQLAVRCVSSLYIPLRVLFIMSNIHIIVDDNMFGQWRLSPELKPNFLLERTLIHYSTKAPADLGSS